MDRASTNTSARGNGLWNTAWGNPLALRSAGILLIALLFRILFLDIKPPHFDEGVNGWFIDQMTQQGHYHYDPGNFHGPLHFYALFVSQTLFGREIWALRLPIVLVSTGCVALMLAFRRFLDGRTCEIAAFAMAVSPGMVFYGRYAIHESWLLLFLLLTVWGLVGLWQTGSVRDLWALGLGVTGMILTKETYVIHLLALALAVPSLLILERFSPSAPLKVARQLWRRRDLFSVTMVCAGLLVFLYTGALLDWPDFTQDTRPIGSLAGLWETFGIWANTGTAGETGHEKPWPYWLELLVRYEWPAAIGLATVPGLLLPRQDRVLRYLSIAGVGTLTAYSIIAYKTPWCLIVIMWPFLFVFGHLVVSIASSMDRLTARAATALLIGVSALSSWQLNFRNYTDEREPYAYVQTLPDINYLMDPLRVLTRINAKYYHITGYILLPENDSHPLSWLLGDFSRVRFLGDTKPPEDLDADFLLVEDDIAADVEDRLQGRYIRKPFILRGGWGNSATLYLREGTFAPILPGQTADFPPTEAKDDDEERMESKGEVAAR